MGKKQRIERTTEEKLQMEMERERQVKALESYQRTGHATPKTRREFLASGIVATGGFLAAPSIYELVMREMTAHAQSAECPAVDPAKQLWPFINLNLSGGWNFAGQSVLHDANRELLPSYTTLGLGLPANFNIRRLFGNLPVPVRTDATGAEVMISQFWDGFLSVTSDTTESRTAVVAFCVRSNDDSSANQASVAGLVVAAGQRGVDLPPLGTRNNSPTGVGQQPSFVRPPAPLRVGNVNDVLGALAPSGILQTQLTNPNARTALMRTISSLSSSQKQVLQSSSSGKTLAKLVECATDKNLTLSAGGVTGVDPRQDANLRTIWGINVNDNNGTVAQASIVYNALNGKSGVGGIDLGGYDYHGNARATTDARDRQAGITAGRIIESAAALGVPVFLHLTSDGAVATTQNETPDGDPSGDSGSRGGGFIIAFHPDGRPSTSDWQIGQFTSAQSADDQFINQWTPARCGLAVFSNYLQLNKKLSMLDQIQGGQFDASILNRVVKFG